MTDDELAAIAVRASLEIASERYSVLELVAALRAEQVRNAEATALINAAVELMTKEQVGQWEGVRAWLEGEGEE